MAKKLSSLSALGGLVYSTETGRLCPVCSNLIAECICSKTIAADSDGIVRIRRETKGRGGKTVTVISGIALAPDELKTLSVVLKKRCGTGGTIKDGIIEIQGEHVDLLIVELINKGFKVKKAGG